MSNIQEDMMEYVHLKEHMTPAEQAIFRNALLEKHINVVYYYINKYVIHDNYADDIKQELFLTFIECVDLYTAETKYPFITYLYFKFKTKTARFKNIKLMVRPFVHIEDEYRKYKVLTQNDPFGDVELLCKKYGLNARYVRAAMKPRACYSLDAPLDGDEDSATMLDVLGAEYEGVGRPDVIALQNEHKRLVLKAIKRLLSDADMKIFYDYFYVYETNATRTAEAHGLTSWAVSLRLDYCFHVIKSNRRAFYQFLSANPRSGDNGSNYN